LPKPFVEMSMEVILLIGINAGGIYICTVRLLPAEEEEDIGLNRYFNCLPHNAHIITINDNGVASYSIDTL